MKRVYGDLYSGTADLYVYFYLRAFELLKKQGMLVFISSNKWFRAGYGKKLRAFVGDAACVHSVTDFRDLPVFESATAYAMIFIAQRGSGRQGTRYTEVPSLSQPYPDILGVIDEFGRELPADALVGETWSFADAIAAKRIEIMKSRGMTLGDYVNGEIYRGVLTGFNKAFVIDGAKRAELIAADPRSDEIIKPLVVGKDIKKWRIDYKDRWLIFARRGIQINDYPAVKNHLEQWKSDLTPKRSRNDKHGRKPGAYKWYEIQDAVGYYEVFGAPRSCIQLLRRIRRSLSTIEGQSQTIKCLSSTLTTYPF